MRVDEIEIYKNRLQQVTNLNNTLYQTPAIISTIIGGLWYVATQSIDKNPIFAAGAFAFAALVGFTGRRLVRRTSAILKARSDDMQKFEEGFTSLSPCSQEPPTVESLAFLMLGVTILSACGAIAAFAHVRLAP